MSADPFPIHPTAVHLKNFRGWVGEHELQLGPGLTLLVGANGAGKSSALNALEWCLFGGEVARKGSGIDERGDWEVRHRAARDEVKVVLTLAVEVGPARLTRSRAAGAKVRDPDLLRLELPDDGLLEGEEVADWLSWNHLPDWTTWKQAFCQHQEQLRVRVTDSGERSLQLGRLLGLEPYQEFNDALKVLKAGDLEQTAQRQLEDVEHELRRALERPGAELRELELQLEARGVARSDLGDGLLEHRVGSLLGDARGLVSTIGWALELPGPDSSDLEAVLRWANDWEPPIQIHKGAVERELGALRGRWQELEVAWQSLEPSERRLEDARAALRRSASEHGDLAALDAELQQLEQQRLALLEQERGRNASLALLLQAAEELRRRGSRAACPVCEQSSSGLEAALARRIEEQGAGDSLRQLEPLKAREARVQERISERTRLQNEVQRAESEHEALAERLRSWLSEGDTHPALAARTRLETWRLEIAKLEEQLRAIDVHLAAFRSEREVLALLAKWRIGRARANAATGDLEQIAAWDELQQVLDEAAELACDLDQLGSLAREAQEQRSAERVEAVNAGLGRHYRRILGDPAGEGVRVMVKSTAARLSYRLVDAQGADITPILNQAALNALAFALLFAQAEDRARQGLPQWLVLDDPGQNLDEAGVAGLARAVVAISELAPTLLATFPGALVRELRELRELKGNAHESARGLQILQITGPAAAPRIEEVPP